MLSNILAGGALGPAGSAAGGANIASRKPEEPVQSFPLLYSKKRTFDFFKNPDRFKETNKHVHDGNSFVISTNAVGLHFQGFSHDTFKAVG